MSNKKDYKNNCFSPNWLEVDLTEANHIVSGMERLSMSEKEVNTTLESGAKQSDLSEMKEVRLESKRRKDLNTLLKELEEIKQNIERVAEKQQRLANLSKFYFGEFAN